MEDDETPPWEVDTAKTEPHWLEVIDPEGWYTAVVKWDGCVDFRRCFNVPRSFADERSDYIHICDLDDFIARLQALKSMAIEHFGEGEWPG